MRAVKSVFISFCLLFISKALLCHCYFVGTTSHRRPGGNYVCPGLELVTDDVVGDVSANKEATAGLSTYYQTAECPCKPTHSFSSNGTERRMAIPVVEGRPFLLICNVERTSCKWRSPHDEGVEGADGGELMAPGPRLRDSAVEDGPLGSSCLKGHLAIQPDLCYISVESAALGEHDGVWRCGVREDSAIPTWRIDSNSSSPSGPSSDGMMWLEFHVQVEKLLQCRDNADCLSYQRCDLISGKCLHVCSGSGENDFMNPCSNITRSQCSPNGEHGFECLCPAGTTFETHRDGASRNGAHSSGQCRKQCLTSKDCSLEEVCGKVDMAACPGASRDCPAEGIGQHACQPACDLASCTTDQICVADLLSSHYGGNKCVCKNSTMAVSPDTRECKEMSLKSLRPVVEVQVKKSSDLPFVPFVADKKPQLHPRRIIAEASDYLWINVVPGDEVQMTCTLKGAFPPGYVRWVFRDPNKNETFDHKEILTSLRIRGSYMPSTLTPVVLDTVTQMTFKMSSIQRGLPAEKRMYHFKCVGQHPLLKKWAREYQVVLTLIECKDDFDCQDKEWCNPYSVCEKMCSTENACDESREICRRIHLPGIREGDVPRLEEDNKSACVCQDGYERDPLPKKYPPDCLKLCSRHAHCQGGSSECRLGLCREFCDLDLCEMNSTVCSSNDPQRLTSRGRNRANIIPACACREGLFRLDNFRCAEAVDPDPWHPRVFVGEVEVCLWDEFPPKRSEQREVKIRCAVPFPLPVHEGKSAVPIYVHVDQTRPAPEVRFIGAGPNSSGAPSVNSRDGFRQTAVESLRWSRPVFNFTFMATDFSGAITSCYHKERVLTLFITHPRFGGQGKGIEVALVFNLTESELYAMSSKSTNAISNACSITMLTKHAQIILTALPTYFLHSSLRLLSR